MSQMDRRPRQQYQGYAKEVTPDVPARPKAKSRVSAGKKGTRNVPVDDTASVSEDD